MPTFTDTLARLGDLSVSFAPAPVVALDDEGLLAAQRSVAELRRRVETQAAVVAAEIAHRSRRELGHTGLAAANGLRTPEELISKLGGTTAREARTLVAAGELLPPEVTRTEARRIPDSPVRQRWLVLIGEAVAHTRLSVEAAALIRVRLGEAMRRLDDDALPADRRAEVEAGLAAATERLIAAAAQLTLEQLAVRASRERDELDLAGIAAREDALRQQRSLRVHRQADGMTRIHGLLDPESAAIVVPILDAATSPRRGGPRFVDPDAVARPDDIVRDVRTTEQLALDTLVELVRLGARVDGGKLLGERKPSVRILVTRGDLETERVGGERTGAAYFEGQPDAVSVATAERYICATGAVPILFDDDTGRVLNLGREQRLFSERQRTAMAARDGGCLMCDRPPSWTEAHHIDHWDEHRGRTDVDDGVLLCRHCHLLVHNRGWRIRRQGGDYLLERPDGDGILRRTALPSRSPARDRLLATA